MSDFDAISECKPRGLSPPGSEQATAATRTTQNRLCLPPLRLEQPIGSTRRIAGLAIMKDKTAMLPRAINQPMNVALQRPWTIEQFLSWASAQDGRYEFDGIQPVAMTGGNARHSAPAYQGQSSRQSRRLLHRAEDLDPFGSAA